MPHRPIITLTTDFGSNDHFVGTMKGVILEIVPDAAIVDICHSVQAFDVLDGALTILKPIRTFLRARCTWSSSIRAWARRGGRLWPRSDGFHFVAPDNGVLSLVYAREPRIHVRHITSKHYFRMPVSNTFHGRDIFAPVAAYLAKQVDTIKFGEEIEDYVPASTHPNRRCSSRTSCAAWC